MREIKQTSFEKLIISCGGEIITWEHDDIVDYLLQVFHRDYDELLLEAVSDNSKKRKLYLRLDTRDVNFGGTVYYNKKLRKFTYIEYSDRYNYGVQFSITSRAAFFGREYYNQIKHIFPLGHSQKKLTAYLMSNYDYIMSTIEANLAQEK